MRERPWYLWPRCWLQSCGGHVESDQTHIWWQCATCGEQKYRARRVAFDVLLRTARDASE